MKEFETCQYKVFDYFKKGLTLVTAGNVKDFSTCTIGWGTMGTLWSGAGINSVITVFVHPSRYTCGYLKGNERFTVSFFSEQYRDALAAVQARYPDFAPFAEMMDAYAENNE